MSLTGGGIDADSSFVGSVASNEEAAATRIEIAKIDFRATHYMP